MSASTKRDAGSTRAADADRAGAQHRTPHSARHHAHRRALRRSRIVVIALAVIYIAGLGAVLLWPERVDGPGGARIRWLLDLLAGWGVDRTSAYDLLESAANVALFVPGGLLLVALLSFRWRWWLPVIGVALSTAAEVAQYLWLPDRVASSADIVANAAGFTIGALLGAAVGAALHRRHHGAGGVVATIPSAPADQLAASTPVPSSTSSTAPRATR
ncbi:VanZ family protein [Schumannella soli]|uniref:VanZ family protein n=1 Tax=Schumannella soli TaxID=2590779 RepID=A0A506XTS0_9MICO|nr:VanZ family protein [Schumannella soli]TPW76224.1 VanZ family protein [Schumannella soli]